MEKAEIFPHFPQQTATTTRKSGRGSKKRAAVRAEPPSQCRQTQWKKAVKRSIIRLQQGKKGIANKAAGVLVQV